MAPQVRTDELAGRGIEGGRNVYTSALERSQVGDTGALAALNAVERATEQSWRFTVLSASPDGEPQAAVTIENRRRKSGGVIAIGNPSRVKDAEGVGELGERSPRKYGERSETKRLFHPVEFIQKQNGGGRAPRLPAPGLLPGRELGVVPASYRALDRSAEVAGREPVQATG